MQREDFAVLTNGFSRSSLEYTLQCIREAEIRKLCLWGGVTHCFAGYGNGEQLKEAKKRVKALGLSVLSFYPEILSYPYNPADSSKAVRGRTKDYYLRCLEAAEEMGASFMTLHPGRALLDEKPERALLQAAEILRRVAEAAEKGPVTPLLLSGAANYAPGLEGTKRLLSQIGCKGLGVELDAGRLLAEGADDAAGKDAAAGGGTTVEESIAEAFFRFKGAIRLIRLYDGPGGCLAFGDGKWPLTQTVKEIEKQGYQGAIAAEFQDRRYVMDPKRALLACVEHISLWCG
ncbi:MAG: TIM barrel protein [Lachnospiraceae bacterium]|nr:TIM barrel protein [Lachnospiraceae bacterium]